MAIFIAAKAVLATMFVTSFAQVYGLSAHAKPQLVYPILVQVFSNPEGYLQNGS